MGAEKAGEHGVKKARRINERALVDGPGIEVLEQVSDEFSVIGSEVKDNTGVAGTLEVAGWIRAGRDGFPMDRLKRFKECRGALRLVAQAEDGRPVNVSDSLDRITNGRIECVRPRPGR